MVGILAERGSALTDLHRQLALSNYNDVGELTGLPDRRSSRCSFR
jgi:hypothetical protein